MRALIHLKQLIKHNLYLSITLIILFISLAFAGVIFAVFSGGNAVDQTSLGFIYLGNSTADQYDSLIDNRIDTWQDDAEYNVTFQGYTFSLDLNLFDFDIETTLDHLVIDQNNKAYFTISETNEVILRTALETTFTEPIMDSFDLDAFINQILTDIENLYSRKTYDLAIFLDENLQDHIIDSTTVTNILGTDVDAIISLVTEIIIPEQSRFSLLDQIGSLNLTNEQLSIIASGLEGVSKNTNFNGFIFDQYNTFPSWVTPGQNVRILKVNQFDFTFFNDLDYGFKLTITELNDTTLSFVLSGIPYITLHESEAVHQAVIPFETIYIENLLIDELTENVIITETAEEFIYRVLIQSGVNGEVIFYNRITTVFGEDPVTIKLFDEQYLPVNAIYHEHIVEK